MYRAEMEKEKENVHALPKDSGVPSHANVKPPLPLLNFRGRKLVSLTLSLLGLPPSFIWSRDADIMSGTFGQIKSHYFKFKLFDR